MRVPHEDKIIHQTFNSKKLEFVWLFDDQRFVFGINKDGSTYIEAGEVNSAGDYIEGSHWCELFPDSISYHNKEGYGMTHTLSIFIGDEKLWNDPRYNLINYNFFSNGKDLVPLIEDAVEFFK